MKLCLLTQLLHLIYIRYVSGFNGINITKTKILQQQRIVCVCARVCVCCVYVCVCLSVGVSVIILKSNLLEKKLW